MGTINIYCPDPEPDKQPLSDYDFAKHVVANWYTDKAYDHARRCLESDAR